MIEDSFKKWMQDWIDRNSPVIYENSYNEESDEWVEIEGIGRFKGLEIVSQEYQDIGEMTINLKYDEWDKMENKSTDLDSTDKKSHISDVSVSLVYQKAVEYAKIIHGEEYDDPIFTPDVEQTIRDFQSGFVTAMGICSTT